jgi:VIT1/CCC1 family predicted Fe2+/Mn2+ transporter
MSDDDFKEYKNLMLDKFDQFKSCREAHSIQFIETRKEISNMRKEVIGEAKEIIKSINKLDKRLTTIEVKSGIWGALGGVVPFVLYYFMKH